MKFNRILSTTILTLAVALPASPVKAVNPFCVGLYELNDDRYAEAIKSFSQVIRSNPRDSVTYYMRGIAHHQLKQYPQALANYNQALTIGVTNPRAVLTNRATVLAKMGDYEQAIEDLKLMLQMYEGDYEYVYRGVAHSYLKLGNRAAAISWLQKLEAKYYSDRRGSSYLYMRDIIKKIRAGGNLDFNWQVHTSYYDDRRCR